MYTKTIEELCGPKRAEFERLLLTLTSRVVSATPACTQMVIKTALEEVSSLFAFDRSSVFAIANHRKNLRTVALWSARGVSPFPNTYFHTLFPEFADRVRQGELVHCEWTKGLLPLLNIGQESLLVIPLRAGGELVGGFAVESVGQDDPWPDEVVKDLARFAELIAFALARLRANDKKRSDQALNMLYHQEIRDHEAERTRLAREIHDQLGCLAAVQLTADLIIHREVISDRVAGRVRLISQHAEELATTLRTISRGLRPSRLEFLGLAGTVASLCTDATRLSEVDFSFESLGSLGLLPPEVALGLYRIVQEATNNIVEHSGARRAWVKIQRSNDALTVSVVDDGAGFHVDRLPPEQSLGLLAMKQRATMLKGELKLQSHPGQGTRVEVQVPSSALVMPPEQQGASADIMTEKYPTTDRFMAVDGVMAMDSLPHHD